MEPTTARVRALKLLGLAAPLLGLAAVWYFADLSSYRSAEEIAGAVRGIGDRRLGFIWVPFGFALATLLFLPVTALIAGTTLAFEPWRGLAFSMAGALLGAALAYGAGRLLGGSIVDWVSGPRLTKLSGKLRANAFRYALIVRLLPFGSFTALNLLAGSLRVPFAGFMLGSAVGLLPGVIFFTVLAGQLPEVIRSPSAAGIAIFAAAAVLMLGVGWLLRRWAERHEPREPAA